MGWWVGWGVGGPVWCWRAAWGDHLSCLGILNLQQNQPNTLVMINWVWKCLNRDVTVAVAGWWWWSPAGVAMGGRCWEVDGA